MTEAHTSWAELDSHTRHLRKHATNLERGELLVASLTNTEQERDLTKKPNCNGYGRIRHFRRNENPNWPPDPLPIDPGRKKLGLPESDIALAQVFQIGACNLQCWYCFVDDRLLTTNLNHSKFLSADELIRLYIEENDPPQIIDLSGGHPEIVPEWVPWMMRALTRKSIEGSTYLWSDDNLSVDFLWQYLDEKDLSLVREYRNYGRVGCFKGFDAKSFSFNTGASPDLFERQFFIMKKLISLGIDMYGYVTLTAPNTNKLESRMSEFIDRLQEVDYYLPLRVVPLEIKEYFANTSRIKPIHLQAIQIQFAVVDEWLTQLNKRYNENELALNICDVPLNR